MVLAITLTIAASTPGRADTDADGVAVASDAVVAELNTGGEIVKYTSVYVKDTVAVKKDSSLHRKLFWSGSVESVDWVSGPEQKISGIKNADDLEGQDGTLIVTYAPGWGRLRLCGDNGSLLALNECLWGEEIRTENIPVIKHSSDIVMSGGVNWYAFEPSGPVHVSLSAQASAAMIISVDGKIRDYEEFWGNLSRDIPLIAGRFIVGIKSLTGRSLDGAPLAVAVRQIPTLKEGNPLDLRLAPGQNRIVWFDVEKKSEIGIGLSMSGGFAEAVLWDRLGKELARGRQIFKILDKGEYRILVSATPTPPAVSPQSPQPTPAAPAPARNEVGVRLYLFGQNNPPADPPEDLINWIIKGGRGTRPSP